jgi:hypothetical protein
MTSRALAFELLFKHICPIPSLVKLYAEAGKLSDLERIEFVYRIGRRHPLWVYVRDLIQEHDLGLDEHVACVAMQRAIDSYPDAEPATRIAAAVAEYAEYADLRSRMNALLFPDPRTKLVAN